MESKEEKDVLEYINGKIIDNQQEMAAANARGDNKTYFTCVGVRTALEAVRDFISTIPDDPETGRR